MKNFPGGSDSKESSCNAEDLGSIPRYGRSPREGNGYPLQYSGLENSMDLYSPWGCKESDITEQLSLSTIFSLLLCNCPLSLSIISSRVGHVRTNDKISFFLKAG